MSLQDSGQYYHEVLKRIPPRDLPAFEDEAMHAGLRTWRIDADGQIHIVPVITTGDAKDHVESVGRG